MSDLKLLYFSCHITLESDELEMLSSLGFSVVSVGNFLLPNNPYDKRTEIKNAIPWSMHDWKEPNINRDTELSEEFLSMNPTFRGVDASQHLNLTKEYLDKFDAIVVSNTMHYMQQILDLNPKCPVIHCTGGQTCAGYESTFKSVRDRLSIVRYCIGEETVSNYAGADAFISGSITDDFLDIDWLGDWDQIITVCRAMSIRQRETSYQTFLEIAKPFNAKIYGSGNQRVPAQYNGGKISYSDLLKAYAHSRVFIATGTSPSPMVYTFIEALGAGIPVICLGSKLARRFINRDNMYALDKHIEHGVNGFCSDSVLEIHDIVNELRNDDDLCRSISREGKQYIFDNFSRPVITAKWNVLFKKLKVL